MPLHLAVKKGSKGPILSYSLQQRTKHYLPVSAWSAHCSQTEERCPFSQPRVCSGSSTSSQTFLYSIPYAWSQHLNENGGYYVQEYIKSRAARCIGNLPYCTSYCKVLLRLQYVIFNVPCLTIYLLKRVIEDALTSLGPFPRRRDTAATSLRLRHW